MIPRPPINIMSKGQSSRPQGQKVQKVGTRQPCGAVSLRCDAAQRDGAARQAWVMHSIECPAFSFTQKLTNAYLRWLRGLLHSSCSLRALWMAWTPKLYGPCCLLETSLLILLLLLLVLRRTDVVAWLSPRLSVRVLVLLSGRVHDVLPSHSVLNWDVSSSSSSSWLKLTPL